MAQLNIQPFQFSGERIDQKELKRLQNYLYTMNEQLRFTLNNLSLDDLGDLTEAIDGSMIRKGSVGDDRLYSRFLLADTAHAKYATFETLTADYIKAEDIEATYARITDLEAATADIGELTADVANIGSILAGNVGTGSLQTLVINSVNADIANATIKSAMIESISTDDVTISSDDGRLVIADNTIQITDAADVVRVQLGLDASEDYGIYVWDAAGALIFDSAGGLHEGGIKEPIIRDDMVADDANISGTKVYVDLDESGGTLDVLFTSMNGELGDLSTSMTAANGKLALLISETEMEQMEEGETLFSKYAALDISLDGLSSVVSAQETAFDDGMNYLSSQISAVSQTVSAVELEFSMHEAYLNGDGENLGLASYIRAGIYGLELGRSDSLVYSQFENDSLKFLERGQSEPLVSIEASVEGEHGGHMKITSVEIVRDLALGEFIFEPRANGNLSLKRRN